MPTNLPKLSIEAVQFSNRESVEKFVRHVKAEIELLWPSAAKPPKAKK